MVPAQRNSITNASMLGAILSNMKIQLLSFICFFGHNIVLTQSQAVLVASISHSSKDTIQVIVEDNNVLWKSDTYNLLRQDDRYMGNLPISKASFFYLKEGANYIHGFIEPGDSLLIRYDAAKKNETLSFDGKKRGVLSLYNKFIQFKLRDKLKAQLPVAKQSKYPFDHLFQFLDSIENGFLKQLQQLKYELSNEAMQALTGYIKAQTLSSRYHAVGLVYHESAEQTIATRTNELTNYSQQQIKNLRRFEEKYHGVSAYVNAVYNVLFRHYADLLLEGKVDKSLTAKFAFLHSQLPPKLRTPVLTMFIEYEMGVTNDAAEIQYIAEQYFTNESEEVYNSYVASKIRNLAALKKGLPAPAFTLADEKGQMVNIDTFRGKVIYIDFWYASCVPCHALFNKLKPVKESYRDHPEVVFLNVSIDPEELWKTALKKFKIEGRHVFTQNQGSEHAIIKDYKVGQYPTTFLIDKEGRVYNATPPDDPNELMKQIETMIKQ